MGKGLVIFVVLGRLGNNLCISKLAPVCNIEIISKVYAFRESEGFGYNDKLQYVTLPKAITNLKPRFLYRIVRWLFEPFQLLYYAIKIRPDYINGVYTLPKGLNSFLVSKMSGIKCIISVIGGKEEIESEIRFPKLWKTLNLFMLKHCYAVTCKGERDIEYMLKNGIEKKKIFIFNGGIDIRRFNSENQPSKTDIIFVGRFDTKKGSFRILEIVQKIITENIDIRCVLLGEGELRKSFENAVRKSGLGNNIHCSGYVVNPEDYYRQSKIFVLPSTNEGLSTAMLESMSCGCVPVVSNVGNTSEAVKNGINGFLIEQYDDIDSYVSCIIKLLQDNKMWSVYSKEAVNQVRNNYSYDVQSGFFGKILEKD
jgi:glycosyltransferase involved in cell wall biosynthesis